jgi:hypothetical protein
MRQLLNNKLYNFFLSYQYFCSLTFLYMSLSSRYSCKYSIYFVMLLGCVPLITLEDDENIVGNCLSKKPAKEKSTKYPLWSDGIPVWNGPYPLLIK